MPIFEAQGENAAITDVNAEFGDLLINYLEQLGVDYVFGIPGGAIEPLYNALARSEARGGPRSIVTRHETGAAFMADGYSRNTGKLGVCCATTGPGATNLITGVASAYENNIPMLVITAQTALSTFGRGAFQESSCTGVNTVGLFEHCTRYNTLVSHPDQFENKLVSAIMTAFQAPMGPAHISVPLDVMRAAAPIRPSYDLPKLLHKPSLLDDSAVEELYEEVLHAKKPVFLIGDEAGEAIGTILSLAMNLDASVVVTPHGKGLVSPYHPLFRGVIGFAGHQSAKDALSDPAVDRVIAVGASLGEWATNGWDRTVLLNQRLIHVEEAEANLTRTPMAKLHVRGRLVTIFEKVLSRYENDPRTQLHAVSGGVGSKRKTNEPVSPERHFSLNEEEKHYSDATPIKPQRLMRELPRLFPPNTNYLADTGASFAWATHYLHPFDRRMKGKRNGRGGLFRASLDFASMGWAIGSAVGTALAKPGEPVVCITGDGSMLMSGQEITVAVEQKLPVVFVILNDSGYGMVRHGQRMTGAEEIGVDIAKTNFASLARAMGADSYVVSSPQDLIDLDVKAICNRAGPTLLDIRIDKTEVPPIGMRTEAIKQND